MNRKASFVFPARTLLFFLVFTALMQAGLSARDLPYPNSHFVVYDGLKIHYRLWEPDADMPRGNVLMVHGFAGSTFTWQEVADSLQQLGYRAVAVDVPPFGYSDRAPRQNQSTTYRAELFNTLLQQEFGSGQWHLAGHSMGGAIVQAMALMYPENYSSVNFVGAALFYSVEPGRGAVPAWLRFPGLTAFLGNIADAWVLTDDRVEGLLASAYGQQPEPEQLQAYLDVLQIPGTARAILNVARFNEEITSLEASQLAIPALAIWGDSDSWVPVESRRRMIDSIENLELVVLEGVGHNPTETHLQEFMAVWLPFLENL